MLNRETLPFKMDMILEFLSSDDDHHSIKEISKALIIPFEDCENIARFLVKYDFAQLEDSGLCVRVELRRHRTVRRADKFPRGIGPA